eukprot:12303553-Alexandrium_andersonii.AAC.1
MEHLMQGSMDSLSEEWLMFAKGKASTPQSSKEGGGQPSDEHLAHLQQALWVVGVVWRRGVGQ